MQSAAEASLAVVNLVPVRHSLAAAHALPGRAWHSWCSEDVSETSLSSLSVVAGSLFIVSAGVLIWKFPVRPLTAASSMLEVLAVTLAMPAVISGLGLAAGDGRRRIAVANAVRWLWRRWYLLVLGGFAGVCLTVAVVELGFAGRLVPLIGLDWLAILGCLLVIAGLTVAILPRRFVVPLPGTVEVLSPLALAHGKRGEAVLAAISVAFLFASALIGFAGAFK
jgi:hypothetical protein